MPRGFLIFPVGPEDVKHVCQHLWHHVRVLLPHHRYAHGETHGPGPHVFHCLAFVLATSRPGRITWCRGCGSESSTPCMPLGCSAMSTHSSTWICSTSLFASGGNPLPTDTYVRLEQVSSPPFWPHLGMHQRPTTCLSPGE